MGTNVLVAGLSIQVACLFTFSACGLEFLWRARKHPDWRNPEFTDLVNSQKFKLFLCGMLFFRIWESGHHSTSRFVLCPRKRLTTWKNEALFGATGLLFIRTVFRSVELSEGFAGELANREVEFMVLDGVMVILAVICLTIFHPGYGFGKRWNEARFPFRTSKTKTDGEAVQVQTVAPDGGEKVETDRSAEGL